MWYVFGGLAWAGLVAMPLVGVIPGLCIVGAGLALAALAAGQAERQTQAEERRKLAQYPSYKY